jgi:hypothetical protein
MDAKITKKRLTQLLSYDWLKIVGAMAGGILIWTLVFTTTATRIMPSQNFGIYNYLGSTATFKFNEYSNLVNSFSYEVIETTTGDATTGGDEYTFQIMEARLVTAEVDVVFTPDTEGGAIQYQTEVGGEVKTSTCLEDFLYRYSNYAYRLDGDDGYLAQMERYLNGYYGGDYVNGAMDKAKIESDFRAYVKESKDKRYKKEQQIKVAVEKEFERIEGYRKALIDFNSYLTEGYISLTEKTLYYNNESGIVQKTGCYSINICPDERMDELKKDVYYRVTDEESEQTKTTALNMNLILINDGETREGYQFESLTFVNHLVKTHCSALNNKNNG